MNEMPNNVIFHCQDSIGEIFVVDEARVRVLYFNDKIQQSRMLKLAPYALITPYEQVMACWQLFNQSADGEVLILGLGGASTTKYCLQQLPQHHIHVVELREKVVSIARDYFHLPIDARLSVYLDDGASFVKQQARLQHSTFNLMLVDIYDFENKQAYAYTEEFLTHCLQILAVNGVFVINLWSTQTVLFESVIAALGKVFSWKILILPVSDSGNVVVFAFHPKAPLYRLSDLYARAKTMQKNSDIAWAQHLDSLLQINHQQLNLSIEG